MPKRSKVKSTSGVVVLVGLGLGLITFGVFSQTLSHPFINYDDPQYVLDIPQVSNGLTWSGLKWSLTAIHGGNWHPLTSASHMLDCSIYGLRPWGHHFTNLLLHTTAVLLLFTLLWQTTLQLWRSAFVAVLF